MNKSTYEYPKQKFYLFYCPESDAYKLGTTIKDPTNILMNLLSKDFTYYTWIAVAQGKFCIEKIVDNLKTHFPTITLENGDLRFPHTSQEHLIKVLSSILKK